MRRAPPSLGARRVAPADFDGRARALLPDRARAYLALRSLMTARDLAGSGVPSGSSRSPENAGNRKERPRALTTWADPAVRGTQLATLRDGIATLPIAGILEPEPSADAWLVGAVACTTVAADLAALLAHPSVRAIVLSVDSPGGEVAGVHQLATQIFVARPRLPIVAHVTGMATSAGYWIAAAAREVIADPTAILGNVGTILTFIDATDAEQAAGLRRITLVASQSPRQALDPATEAGREDWQQALDGMAAVFLDDLARFRRMPRRTIARAYGDGACFVGASAVAVGLADATGTAQAVHTALLAELAESGGAPPPSSSRTRKAL